MGRGRFKGLPCMVKQATLVVALGIACVSPRAWASEPLRILSATPRGSDLYLGQASRIVVVFDAPMTPLRGSGKHFAALPVEIRPKIRGAWRWEGTTVLAFVPDDALPAATRFRVTVPAGIRSLTGALLDSAYSWEFVTPGVHLTDWEPRQSAGWRKRDGDTTIFLLWDQDINPDSCLRRLTIVDSLGSAVPFRLRRLTREECSGLDGWKWKTTNSAAILPDIQLWKGAWYKVFWQGGDEPPAEPTLSLRIPDGFHVLPPHGPVDPELGCTIAFSNSVSFTQRDTLDSLIRLVPATAGLSVDGRERSIRLGSLLPETTYSVTISGLLMDIFSQHLGRDTTISFRTDSFSSRVVLKGPGVIETDADRSFPILLRNLDSLLVGVQRIAIDDIVPFMSPRVARVSYDSYWEANENLLRLYHGDTTGSPNIQLLAIRPTVPRNSDTTVLVDLTKSMVGERNAMLLIQTVDPGADLMSDRNDFSVVQVTGLGISASYFEDSTLIWVSRLGDGSPVGGATVEIRDVLNNVRWEGVTGEDGFAGCPGKGSFSVKSVWAESNECWTIVREGNDVAFLCSAWDRVAGPIPATRWWPWNNRSKMRGSLFTDRGLYQPGEKVGIKGILREWRDHEWTAPDDSDLVATINDSRGNPLRSFRPELSAFGSFTCEIVLASSGPTGEYSVVVTKGKRRYWWDRIASSFRVEQFRPAQFDVHITPGRSAYIAGDTLFADISAMYLFGLPVANQEVTWRTWQSYWTPGFAAYPRFSFQSSAWWERSRKMESELGLDSLDTSGHAPAAINIPRDSLGDSFEFNFEARVHAADEQTIASRGHVHVFGASTLVGIGMDHYLYDDDEPPSCEIIAVDTAGVTKAGQRLRIAVYQWWHTSGGARTDYWYKVDGHEDSLVFETNVVADEKPVRIALPVNRQGSYLAVVSGYDTDGTPLRSVRPFSLRRKWRFVPPSATDSMVSLTLEKPYVRGDDSLRFVAVSPCAEGTAVVSVSQEGLLERFTLPVRGHLLRFGIPVRKELRPGVDVVVEVVRPTQELLPDALTGIRYKSVVTSGELRVDIPDYQDSLLVAVWADKRSYAPGDSVTVMISVRDTAGNPVRAEIAVSVPDKGVISHIDYRLPNPYGSYALEATWNTPWSTDSRLHLLHRNNYQRAAWIRDKRATNAASLTQETRELPLPSARRLFLPSAFWNPSLVTDEHGKAQVTFVLPDNITGFLIMATANTSGAGFGYGQDSITVRKRLVLQPSAPRYLRNGDSCEAGVVAINNTDSAETVFVAMTTGDNNRPDTLRLMLRPGGSGLCRRPVSTGALTPIQMRCIAWSGTDRDEVEWTVPVRATRRIESSALFASTTSNSAVEILDIPSDIRSDTGNVQISLSSTALSGLEGAAAYLLTYTYGCIEQRTSKILPLIAGSDLLESFGLADAGKESRRELVRNYLSWLATVQNYDGGFSTWAGWYYSHKYISGYVYYAMILAQHHGYAVDEGVLRRTREYLLRGTPSDELMLARGYGNLVATQALVAYALALDHHPDEKRMKALFDVRAWIPLFARAYLLRALVASHGDRKMIGRLSSELTNMLKIAPTTAHFEDPESQHLWWCFDSDVRTTAIILQALLEAGETCPWAPKAVRWLNDRMKKGRWRSTQENWYVFDALTTYFRKFESSVPDFIASARLGTRSPHIETFQGRSFAVAQHSVAIDEAMTGREIPVSVTRKGRGRLYYGVRMNYIPLKADVEQSEGFSVTRTLRALGPDTSAATTFPVGSDVLVTITITTHQSRNYVILDDPLPAGLEAVNPWFETSETKFNIWYTGSFYHREIHDDRILFFANELDAGTYTVQYVARALFPGRFDLPGTRVEATYEPEVFGQTASITVQVK